MLPCWWGVRSIFGTTQPTADEDGEITAWSWDFGDPASGAGNVAKQRDPVHVFAAAGIYRAALTVRDDEGLEATDSRLVTVGL